MAAGDSTYDRLKKGKAPAELPMGTDGRPLTRGRRAGMTCSICGHKSMNHRRRPEEVVAGAAALGLPYPCREPGCDCQGMLGEVEFSW